MQMDDILLVVSVLRVVPVVGVMKVMKVVIPAKTDASGIYSGINDDLLLTTNDMAAVMTWYDEA